MILLCTLLMLCACNERKLNETQVKGLDNAKQNVAAVADVLHDVAQDAGKASAVVEASATILDSQVQTIEVVLPPDDLKPGEQGKSTVNKQKLLVNPEEAAKETVARDDANREEIQASTTWWQKLTSWTGWAGLGGLAATLAIAAQRVLLPALSPWLSDPLIRATPVVGKFMKKAEEGEATINKYRGLVSDSMIARVALQKFDEVLDPELKAKLLPFIQQLAGKNIEGIDDLFSHVANANSVDRGANSETRELLNQVLDTMPTENGVPVTNISTLPDEPS